MNVSALPPTAPTTLVIMLGASAWPNSPGFQASQAFTHAAQGFRAYLLDPHGLGLSAANLCDLFDAQASASDQLELFGSFLDQRAQALKAANQAVRDVLVYFVGHGGFAGSSADFYLLPRRANATSLRASGMAIDALAEVLLEKARQTRRYLFLDCCFAAAAFSSFQGGPDQTAITKTLDAFSVRARGSGFPRKGTVLLCSSNQKTPSLILPDESCTMFSSALLDVLRNGDPHRSPHLSVRDINDLTQNRLAALPLPKKNAPRPDLHSPDQSEGDVADVPLFPNRMRNVASPPSLQHPSLFPSTSSQRSKRNNNTFSQTPAVPPTPVRHSPASRPVKEPQKQSHPVRNILLSLLMIVLLGVVIANIIRGFQPSTSIPPPLFIGETATASARATATAGAIDMILRRYNSLINGTPAFSDPLNDPNRTTWALGSSRGGTCTIENGAFHDITGTDLAWNCFNHGQQFFANFVYRIQMTILQGASGGITFRAASQGLYRFDIHQDGGYTFQIGQQRTTSSVPSSHIKAGFNQTNTIAVMAKGAIMSLFINDQYVTSVEDTTLTNGIFGVIAEGQPADVAFSNAKIWTM